MVIKNKKLNNIITIDGPAGSGKSTIAKILAKRLGFTYIDTGAMYRAVTLLALENNIDPDSEKLIYPILEKSKILLDNIVGDEDSYTKIRLNGKDVTDEIRSKEVGQAVSIVSKHSKIRKYLVMLQRKMAENGKVVLEGRDTGSVVCPDAMLKIYLTANMKERIERRRLQLAKKGQTLEDSIIEKEIKTRDKIDSSRKDSPLIIPEKAIVIDTSHMSIEEVIGRIIKIFDDRTDV